MRPIAALAAFAAYVPATLYADGLIHSYDASILPADDSVSWSGASCESICHESIENGFLVYYWPTPGDRVGYLHYIAAPPVPPPPTLWIEWRFRSHHPIGRFFTFGDGDFFIQYAGLVEDVSMYGDAAVSFEGSDYILDLELDEFHSYRFESLDGVNYRVSVDGDVFIVGSQNQPNGYSAIQFSGYGGCNGDFVLNLVNAWDFVRYGTIGYGERIVASDPPGGFVDARQHASLDRFTITFDSPNYVYLDEITVEVMSSATKALSHEATKGESFDLRYSQFAIPVVVATRRLDNGPPDVVEIVLDRPIPYNATTRFTFTDGVAENVVEYTFAPGDTNGDGRANLADFAYFQNCFELGTVLSIPAPCVAFDFDADSDIDVSDFAAFERVFSADKRCR